MPDLFPELSWFRDTPVPEGLVIIQGQPMLLVDFGHKVIDLGGLRRRGPPELLCLWIKTFNMRHDQVDCTVVAMATV
jgi:hypothetical protein